jgi:hypothetical protein
MNNRVMESIDSRDMAKNFHLVRLKVIAQRVVSTNDSHRVATLFHHTDHTTAFIIGTRSILYPTECIDQIITRPPIFR